MEGINPDFLIFIYKLISRINNRYMYSIFTVDKLINEAFYLKIIIAFILVISILLFKIKQFEYTLESNDRILNNKGKQAFQYKK